MDLSRVDSNHNAEVIGKAFTELPSNSILDKFTTIFTHRSDSQQLEQQTAILKFFRSLSGEENEDIMQGDVEFSGNLKKNRDLSFGDVFKHDNSSSKEKVPVEREQKNKVQVTVNTTGSDADSTEEVRNYINQLEKDVQARQSQQSIATNIESGCSEECNMVKQTFDTNQLDESESPERLSQCMHTVNQTDKVGDSVDECVLNELMQPRRQHIPNIDCAVSVKQNEAEELIMEVATADKNIQSTDFHNKNMLTYNNGEEHFISGPLDIVTPANMSTEGVVSDSQISSTVSIKEPATSGYSNKRNAVITLTRIGPAVKEQFESGETVAPILGHDREQTDGPSSFIQEDEEEMESVKEDDEDEEKGDISLDSTSDFGNPCSPQESVLNSAVFSIPPVSDPPPGSTSTRSTFSPGSPTDTSIQLPALFSGLRVLRKGVAGPEHDTITQIKPSSQGARRAILPELEKKQGDSKIQGSFLNQISQFLNQKKKGEERGEMTIEEKLESSDKSDRADGEAEGEMGETTEDNDSTEYQEGEKEELHPETEEPADASELAQPIKPPVSSAEAAFDAFKAFFTPKPLKKDPVEKVDLDAMRKKIRGDKDVLRALF
ncbi:uncharacterized protein LOC115356210 [Myripristis murdjan]|uniref:uncharacterized protein LOC115356210 n=1 Tax=Myripristis murdjan TaxID=586833 RepID=UPI0011763889|nr:uncharacterized protein LOC115356210 [Myripristis murdjan]